MACYEGLASDALVALAQIVGRRYDAGVPRGFKTLLHWGIAFHKKDALAKVHQTRR